MEPGSTERIGINEAFRRLSKLLQPDDACQLLAEAIDDGTVEIFYKGRRFTRRERNATRLKVQLQQSLDGQWRAGIHLRGPLELIPDDDDTWEVCEVGLAALMARKPKAERPAGKRLSDDEIEEVKTEYRRMLKEDPKRWRRGRRQRAAASQLAEYLGLPENAHQTIEDEIVIPVQKEIGLKPAKK
jgi:hypothetical protein